MDILLDKFKEVAGSVLPIVAIVLLLHFTIAPLALDVLFRFIIGAIFVIIGLGIFLFGAEIGITPIGSLLGKTIAKTNKTIVVIVLGFVLGFLITVAEPDLAILANQIFSASGGALAPSFIITIVSIGVGIMVVVGLLRILFNGSLNRFFIGFYGLLFILAFFVSEEFLAISVDASGATTGAMTTPFILALGYGVSQLKGGKTAEEDSFGLVGLASIGPILMIMLMSIILNFTEIQGDAVAVIPTVGILKPFLAMLPHEFQAVTITLIPLTIVYLLFNHFGFQLKRRRHHQILRGLGYTLVGLTLFLTGVNAGFMEVGRIMGETLARDVSGLVLVLVGFGIGTVVVLAEPAVYVLTEQIEDVTAGGIPKRIILITLSIAIALAVSLSMIRILIPAIKLWHFLLPGFGLALYLSRKVPPIFVGVGFDAGGVASGPMTATFVLAFAQGVATVIPTANVMVDGFGIIAMIAMMPIVAVQILGVIYKKKRSQS